MKKRLTLQVYTHKDIMFRNVNDVTASFKYDFDSWRSPEDGK
jgi:hypothetical protein